MFITTIPTFLIRYSIALISISIFSVDCVMSMHILLPSTSIILMCCSLTVVSISKKIYSLMLQYFTICLPLISLPTTQYKVLVKSSFVRAKDLTAPVYPMTSLKVVACIVYGIASGSFCKEIIWS